MSTPCNICVPLDCSFPADLEIYGLQGPNGPWSWRDVDFGGFPVGPNGMVIVPVSCPPGYFCPPGSVGGHELVDPAAIPTIHPPRFSIIPIRARCCDGSYVVAAFPSNGTQQQYQQIVALLLNQVAMKQAYCTRLSKLADTNKPRVFIPGRRSGSGSLKLQPIGGSETNDTAACLARPLTVTIAAKGSNKPPYSFDVVGGSLPVGCVLTENLNGTALIISGTPTAPGDYKFLVRVTDKGDPQQVDQAEYSISVMGLSNSAPNASGEITLTQGHSCTPYSLQLTVKGGTGPYTFDGDPDIWPDWLDLTGDGLLTGTPLQADGGINFKFNVIVTDSTGLRCAQKVGILVSGIVCPALGSIPSGAVGTPYSYQVPSSFGVAPYTFNLTAGTLPSNLTMNSSGLISGVPLAPTGAPAPFQIRVTDKNGCYCDLTGNISVYPITNQAQTILCPSNHLIAAGTPAGKYAPTGPYVGFNQQQLDSLAQVDAVNRLSGLGCPICNLHVDPMVTPYDLSVNASTTCGVTVDIAGYASGFFGGSPVITGVNYFGFAHDGFGKYIKDNGASPSGLYTITEHSTGTFLWSWYY